VPRQILGCKVLTTWNRWGMGMLHQHLLWSVLVLRLILLLVRLQIIVSLEVSLLDNYLGQFVLQFCYKIIRSKPTVSMLTKRM